MNLYLLKQAVNAGYDTFDSCVVVAADEESARLLHPKGWWNQGGRSDRQWSQEHAQWGSLVNGRFWSDDTWAPPDEVTVTLIGVADPSLEPGTVVCASFNAG